MLNPKKWPKKYQYLFMFIFALIIFFFTISKGHAEEPAQFKENHGKELVKDAASMR